MRMRYHMALGRFSPLVLLGISNS